MFRNVALQSLSFASSCQRLRRPMWAMNQEEVCAAQAPRIVLQILGACATSYQNPDFCGLSQGNKSNLSNYAQCFHSRSAKRSGMPRSEGRSYTARAMAFMQRSWNIILNHEAANQQTGSITPLLNPGQRKSGFKSGTQSTRLIVDYQKNHKHDK